MLPEGHYDSSSFPKPVQKSKLWFVPPKHVPVNQHGSNIWGVKLNVCWWFGSPVQALVHCPSRSIPHLQWTIARTRNHLRADHGGMLHDIMEWNHLYNMTCNANNNLIQWLSTKIPWLSLANCQWWVCPWCPACTGEPNFSSANTPPKCDCSRQETTWNWEFNDAKTRGWFFNKKYQINPVSFRYWKLSSTWKWRFVFLWKNAGNYDEQWLELTLFV